MPKTFLLSSLHPLCSRSFLPWAYVAHFLTYSDPSVSPLFLLVNCISHDNFRVTEKWKWQSCHILFVPSPGTASAIIHTPHTVSYVHSGWHSCIHVSFHPESTIYSKFKPNNMHLPSQYLTDGFAGHAPPTRSPSLLSSSWQPLVLLLYSSFCVS